MLLHLPEDGGYVSGFALLENSEEPGVVYTEQEVDISKGNPYGATVLKYKYETKRSQAEVTNIAYDVLSFGIGQRKSDFDYCIKYRYNRFEPCENHSKGCFR